MTIDRLWDRLWSGGMANPLTVIEQISYLILLRRLSDQNSEREGARFEEYPRLRWDALRSLPDEQRTDVLREQLIPFLRARSDSGDALSQALRDAAFVIPKATLVRDCMTAIDDLDLAHQDPDFQGNLYEYLLTELNLAGSNGQFRTPRHVINAMVQLVAPQTDETVADPAAGTAGFLIGARGFPATPIPDAQLVGWDFDASMVRLGVMNLIFHGIEQPALTYADALSRSFPRPSVDVVLANPPFTGGVNRDDVNPDLALDTGRTELLFVELCRQMMRPSTGRAAVIVPEGLLFGTSAAHTELRRRLVRESSVRAVVSLPSGVFRPYSNVKTALLWLSATPSFDDVWFCRVRSDGLTLDDKRAPVADNELGPMPAAVRGAVLGEEIVDDTVRAVRDRMWAVPQAEIEQRGFDLAPSTFQLVGEGPAGEPDPLEQLTRVEQLEEDLRRELDAVRNLLEGGA